MSRAAAKPKRAPRRLERSPAPRIPRRVSGPARGRSAARASLAPAPRLVGFAASLPDRRWVGRLVNGSGWIGVLGVLLIGLVAVQVSLLNLNAGIGRAVERSGALERGNGVLRAQVSRLESGERIQAEATALGMVMPPPGEISYVRAEGATDAAAAASALEQVRFNDPAKAIPLPGAEEPDPYAVAAAKADDADEDSTTAEDDSAPAEEESATAQEEASDEEGG